MSTSDSSVLKKQRARIAWLEASLDTSIVAYESHRNALENVYAYLAKWQQSPGEGCIHISPAALSELLNDIDDVLEQCALRLQPIDGATPAADSPTEQAHSEHCFRGAHLYPDNARGTRRNKAVPAPPQQQPQMTSRSVSELSRGSRPRGAEDDLHEASTATTESRQHQQPKPVLQYRPLSSSRSRTSSVLPAMNEREAAAVQPVYTTSADSTPPPSQAVAGSWKPQPRPRAQPRDRMGVALTPWPIMDDRQQPSGTAAGPVDRTRSDPTPPSARLRAEENHDELPAPQYSSYKRTGRPLLPSPERRAAAEELAELAAAEEEAKASSAYQQSFGGCSHSRESERNCVSAGHRWPSPSSSLTSASHQLPPPPPLQGEQHGQSYWSEEQDIPYRRGSSAAGEHRSSNTGAGSHVGSGRSGLSEEGPYAGIAPAAASGHRAAAAVTSHHSHPAPSHQQSSAGGRALSRTSSTLKGSPSDAAVAALESLSYASSCAPHRPGQPRGGAAGAAAMYAGHPVEASQAGSLGLVYTPSVTPQRDSDNGAAVTAPQQLSERRRLRTYSQRPIAPKTNDSSQVESTVYHRRTLSPSAGRKPLRADSPETLRFMEREDAFLEKQRQKLLGEEHRDPLQPQNNAGATLYITANPGGQPVANGGKAVKEAAPEMTAVEEQLIAEHTILRTQLEKMQMEMSIAVARHRERGNEQRYTQLNTRMKRVMKDLDRVEWELRVVRNIDRQSRSQSPASGI
ncbi:hypothetical protein conserved [Leishmania donovani]|uniref:Hypothetical_protein_conserved n=1 Tax=Leishmania donovani TaxID=5661 RepID=A0A504XX69_LEIDO|nr:hypothetical protein CGC20_24245 [Leishmania donovani]CAJ1986045.1 hypothetical protein conserved [Leishmania donovani]VDZ41947.1 hypothetical_protein_conserved [Leishmania donovani]